MIKNMNASLKRTSHKRKISHQMIVASDAVDSIVKPLHIQPKVFWGALMALCILVGAVGGYLYYQTQIFAAYEQRIDDRDLKIAELNLEKEELQAQIDSLNNQITILSTTVNAKVANEAELAEALQSQAVPTEFPLTGAASLEIVDNYNTQAELDENGNPVEAAVADDAMGLVATEDAGVLAEMTADYAHCPYTCVFSASEGSMVVSTGSGIVTSIEEDATYGKIVTVDHGNGYVSTYMNSGDVQVHIGDEISKGATIFIISGNNSQLVYEIALDGEYIDPMDLFSISG